MRRSLRTALACAPVRGMAARWAAGAGCAAALLAALCSAGEARAAAPRPLTDDRGHVLTLKAPPQRIVSLLPSLTESVCELGACERLVGVDRFSDWPASVRGLPKLGGLEDTPIERIVSLRPDLVLTAVSSRALGRLESLGIPVLALEPQRLADTRRVLELVAQALGRPGEGERLWQRIDQRLAQAAARVPPGLRGQRVYFEVSSAPYAAGEASFVGEVIARLGLANVVPAAMGPFPKLNPEFVVRARPDLLMASAAGMAEMPGRPGWAALAAVRERRGCAFSEAQYEVLVRPGPRLAEAGERIADCLERLGAARPSADGHWQ